MYKIYINSGSGYGEPLRKDNETDLLKFIKHAISDEAGDRRILVIEQYKGTDYFYGLFMSGGLSLNNNEKSIMSACPIRRRTK